MFNLISHHKFSKAVKLGNDRYCKKKVNHRHRNCKNLNGQTYAKLVCIYLFYV
jgi:hypothetical protein